MNLHWESMGLVKLNEPWIIQPSYWYARCWYKYDTACLACIYGSQPFSLFWLTLDCILQNICDSPVFWIPLRFLKKSVLFMASLNYEACLSLKVPPGLIIYKKFNQSSFGEAGIVFLSQVRIARKLSILFKSQLWLHKHSQQFVSVWTSCGIWRPLMHCPFGNLHIICT